MAIVPDFFQFLTEAEGDKKSPKRSVTTHKLDLKESETLSLGGLDLNSEETLNKIHIYRLTSSYIMFTDNSKLVYKKNCNTDICVNNIKDNIAHEFILNKDFSLDQPCVVSELKTKEEILNSYCFFGLFDKDIVNKFSHNDKVRIKQILKETGVLTEEKLNKFLSNRDNKEDYKVKYASHKVSNDWEEDPVDFDITVNGKTKTVYVYVEKEYIKKIGTVKRDSEGNVEKTKTGRDKIEYSNPTLSQKAELAKIDNGDQPMPLVTVEDKNGNVNVTTYLKVDDKNNILIPWIPEEKKKTKNEIIDELSGKSSETYTDYKYTSLLNKLNGIGMIDSVPETSDDKKAAISNILTKDNLKLQDEKTLGLLCKIFKVESCKDIDESDYYVGVHKQTKEKSSNTDRELLSSTSAGIDDIASSNAIQTIAMLRKVNNSGDTTKPAEKFYIKLFNGNGLDKSAFSIANDASRYGKMDVPVLMNQVEINQNSVEKIKNDISANQNITRNTDEVSKIINGEYNSLSAAIDAVKKLFSSQVKSVQGDKYYASIIAESPAKGNSKIIDDKFINIGVKKYDSEGKPEYYSDDESITRISKKRFDKFVPGMVNYMFAKITESYMQKLMSCKDNKDEFNAYFDKYVSELNKFKDQIGDVTGADVVSSMKTYRRNASTKSGANNAVMNSSQTFYVPMQITDDPEIENAIHALNVNSEDFDAQAKIMKARYESAIEKATADINAAIKKYEKPSDESDK